MNRASLRRRRRMGGGGRFDSPLDLGSALWGWYDPSAANGAYEENTRVTAAADDLDQVGSFSDFSGNGRHLSQATASKRFTLRTAAQNGRNVVESDGVDDFLQSASLTLSQPFHILAVFQLQTLPAVGQVWSGLSAAADFQVTPNGGNPFWQLQAGAFLSAQFRSAAPWWIAEAQFSGSSSSLRMNLNAATTGNAGSNNAGGFTLGSDRSGTTQFVNCRYGEIIIANRLLPASQADMARSYLNTRWAVY